MTPNDDPQQETLSRGDKLLAEIKRNRIRPGQFRLRTLFLATIGFAFLFGLPRMTGWSYSRYFEFLWMAAFGLAPLLALVVTSLCPWLSQRNRTRLAVACIALAIVPILVYVTWVGEAHTLPMLLMFTFLWFWLPQSVCIWGVWYFLFRKA